MSPVTPVQGRKCRNPKDTKENKSRAVGSLVTFKPDNIHTFALCTNYLFVFIELTCLEKLPPKGGWALFVSGSKSKEGQLSSFLGPRSHSRATAI